MPQSPTGDLPEASAPETEREPDSPATARWAGRRLADVTNQAFQLALARGDIRTAEELLVVMERAWERERAWLGFNRRHADPLLDLARRELQTMKGKRHPR